MCECKCKEKLEKMERNFPCEGPVYFGYDDDVVQGFLKNLTDCWC